jgi:hypothetical protein
MSAVKVLDCINSLGEILQTIPEFKGKYAFAYCYLDSSD